MHACQLLDHAAGRIRRQLRVATPPVCAWAQQGGAGAQCIAFRTIIFRVALLRAAPRPAHR